MTATPPALSIDQRVVLHGVSWEDYEAVLAIRGESSGVRIAYREGELELMSPSLDHERLKTLIARLVEAYAEERDVELNGYGSWTVKHAEVRRGGEADECYVIGEPDVSRPDFAIEVVWTHGGLDKLDIYRGLGVPEVWMWIDDRITVHGLGRDGYEPVPGSQFPEQSAFPAPSQALIGTLLRFPTASITGLRQ